MSAGKKSLLTCGQFSSVAPGVGKLEAHSQRGLDVGLWVRASRGAAVGVGGSVPPGVAWRALGPRGLPSAPGQPPAPLPSHLRHFRPLLSKSYISQAFC